MEKGIVKFYEGVRKALGFNKKEDESWCVAYGDSSFADVTIKEKKLVTPTDEVLRKADWDHYIAFHPICENVRRKKSIVQERLQAYVALRIKNIIIEQILAMTAIAVDSDSHDKLSADQREFLPLFGEITEKTYKTFTTITRKFVSAESAPGVNELVSVGVRRGGTWKGEDYSRLCTITFPVIDEEVGSDGKIYGTKVTNKERKIFFDVLRYILPRIDVPEAYCYGTRSDTAPNFHCLMSAFHAVAVDLNRVTRLLGEIDPEFKNKFHVVTSWANDLPTLSDFRDVIPILDGNEGEPRDDDAKKEKAITERKVQRKAEEERRNNRSSSASGNRFSRSSSSNRFSDSRRDDDDRDERRSRRDDRDDRYERRGNRFSRRDRYDDDRDDDRRSRRSRRDDYDDDRYDRRGRRREREDDKDENGVTIMSSSRRSYRDYDDDYDRGSRYSRRYRR